MTETPSTQPALSDDARIDLAAGLEETVCDTVLGYGGNDADIRLVLEMLADQDEPEPEPTQDPALVSAVAAHMATDLLEVFEQTIGVWLDHVDADASLASDSAFKTAVLAEIVTQLKGVEA